MSIIADPVVKHGSHNQKDHAGKGGRSLPEGWRELSAEERRAAIEVPSFIPESGRAEFVDMLDNFTVIEGPNGTKVKIDHDSPLTDEELGAQMEHIALLQRIAPVDGLEVVYSEKPFTGNEISADTVGYVINGTSTINLRPSAVHGMPGTTDHLMPHAERHKGLYPLTHEYGHVIDRRSAEKARDDREGVVSGVRGELTGVSRYGLAPEENPAALGREMFAEAWTGWVMSAGKSDAPFVRYYAGLYGWDSGGPGRPPTAGIAKAALAGPLVIADTFTTAGARAYQWVDGKPEPIETKSVVVVEPVAKHGSHDQSAHGRRGSGGGAAAGLAAGNKVDVPASQVGGVLDQLKDHPGAVDLTNLSVDGSAVFSTGNLGIAREDMPQIPKSHRDQFLTETRARGVQVTDQTVDPRTLQPTQGEMNAVNVAGMRASMLDGSFPMTGQRILVSSDGHVLDGHHRWAALTAIAYERPGTTIDITRVGMPIRDLLVSAADFNDRNGIKARGLGDFGSRVRKALGLSSVVVVEPVAKHGLHNQKDHAGKHGGGSPHITLDPRNPDDVRKAFTQTIRDEDGNAYELSVDRVSNIGQTTHVNGTIRDKGGAPVGEFQRTLNSSTGTMDNALLEIDRAHRGKGVATEFQKASEEAALALGMERITVYAADDGSLAWASKRFGFEFAGAPEGLSSVRRSAPPTVRKRLDAMSRRFDGDRAGWPKPHEIIDLGAFGERVLALGWEGQKPASRVTKQAAEAMFHVTVLGVDSRVAKHGTHNQKDHGRKGSGSATGGPPNPSGNAAGDLSAAAEDGSAMGIGWPAPADIGDEFDAVRNLGPGSSPDAGEDLINLATDQGSYAGLDELGSDSSDEKSDAQIYGEAVYMRAESLRQQDAAWSRADEQTRAATEAMVNDVRANGTVCVATDPDSAMAILEDGRFQSQFETFTSGGMLGTDVRARQETMAFDMHPSAAPESRPIYGYVASDQTLVGAGGPGQYGEVRFVLRDSARERATMTVGDSLSGYSIPVPMAGGPVSQRQAWDAVSRNGFGIHGMTAHENVPRFQQRGYFEAQVHGGVRVGDIERIHLMGSRDDWYDTVNEIVDAAAKHGIPVEFDE